jgi:ABC-type lipoprotein export system ATPase subunit
MPAESAATSTEHEVLLQLREVHCEFQRGDATPTAVLRGVSLQVARGESLAIVGPSGSGKSTLLNLLGGLCPPNSGEVWFAGRRLDTQSASEWAQIRGRDIGFIFQAHHLLPQCTALENVLVPTLVNTTRPQRQAAQARGEELLEHVGLAERLDHFPAQLSGGECQRVAVVRALINNPDVVLADEPTGSLDQENAEELGQLLVELNREQSVALVVVTHSPALARRMQRVLRLQGGQLHEATEES